MCNHHTETLMLKYFHYLSLRHIQNAHLIAVSVHNVESKSKYHPSLSTELLFMQQRQFEEDVNRDDLCLNKFLHSVHSKGNNKTRITKSKLKLLEGISTMKLSALVCLFKCQGPRTPD